MDSLSADVTVRPATTDDAQRIGEIHARALQRYVRSCAPSSLTAVQDQGMDSQTIGAQWLYSISSPPSLRHCVLVACEKNEVVGVAAFAPSDLCDGNISTVQSGESSSQSVSTLPIDESVAEILVLEVDSSCWHRGHGSRLLNAVGETARSKGITQLYVWLNAADDEKTHFYSSAGFAPSGKKRCFCMADTEVNEHQWVSILADSCR